MKSKKQSSYYKVGLGNNFLNRASLIFVILLTLAFGSLGAAAYADFKSGNLQKKLVEPVKQYLSKAFQGSDKKDGKQPTIKLQFTSTSSATINTNRQKPATKPTNIQKTTPQNQTTYSAPAPLPTYSGKSYEQLLKEQEEWSKQKNAENERWFNERVQQNQQWSQTQNKINEQNAQNWFNQKTQEAQQQQDAWWAEQTKSMEEWRKQNGF